MKNRLLLLVAFFLPSIHFAQDFGAIGTQWYYSEHAQGAAPPNSEYVHLHSTRDSMVLNTQVHVIDMHYFTHSNGVKKWDPWLVYQVQDTVYQYSYQRQDFIKALIFNGNTGDTLLLDNPDTSLGGPLTYRLVIDSVSLDTVDGQVLKKYHTFGPDAIQFYGGGIYMDQIGGLDWFQPRGTIIPEAGGPIRCFMNPSIDSMFQTVPCNQWITSSIIETKNGVQIFPNPTNGIIHLVTASPVSEVILYGVNGIHREWQTSMFNISELPDGVYLLHISLEDGRNFKERIIKSGP